MSRHCMALKYQTDETGTWEIPLKRPGANWALPTRYMSQRGLPKKPCCEPVGMICKDHGEFSSFRAFLGAFRTSTDLEFSFQCALKHSWNWINKLDKKLAPHGSFGDDLPTRTCRFSVRSIFDSSTPAKCRLRPGPPSSPRPSDDQNDGHLGRIRLKYSAALIFFWWLESQQSLFCWFFPGSVLALFWLYSLWLPDIQATTLCSPDVLEQTQSVQGGKLRLALSENTWAIDLR